MSSATGYSRDRTWTDHLGRDSPTGRKVAPVGVIPTNNEWQDYYKSPPASVVERAIIMINVPPKLTDRIVDRAAHQIIPAGRGDGQELAMAARNQQQ